MYIRKANDRGLTDIGWLYSRHSFSFGDYYDPQHIGFHALRVINDDIIAKGAGFGMHGHRDMEIVTLVVDGELQHKDSLGHSEVLRPGEVQVMTAGSGIRHSEFNPSPSRDAHILQIWIEPKLQGLPPAYAQREFPQASRRGRLVRVAGPTNDSDNALTINQDAHIYVTSLTAGDIVSYCVQPERAAWIHVIGGDCSINHQHLSSGDAVAIEVAGEVRLEGKEQHSELILFDLGKPGKTSA
jgi:redox-sensitive bicupin YhaK (pirin superfamily)